MLDRRFGFRIPLSVFATSYVHDRAVRALCSDVSDTGVAMTTAFGAAPPPGTVVAVELQLPGVADTVWAAGEVRRRIRAPESFMTSDIGLRFTGIARAHARLLRDYCVEARRDMTSRLLSRARLGWAAP